MCVGLHGVLTSLPCLEQQQQAQQEAALLPSSNASTRQGFLTVYKVPPVFAANKLVLPQAAAAAGTEKSCSLAAGQKYCCFIGHLDFLHLL